MRAQFPNFLAKGNARELRKVALLLAMAREEEAAIAGLSRGQLSAATRKKNRAAKELAFAAELRAARGEA